MTTMYLTVDWLRRGFPLTDHTLLSALTSSSLFFFTDKSILLDNFELAGRNRNSMPNNSNPACWICWWSLIWRRVFCRFTLETQTRLFCCLLTCSFKWSCYSSCWHCQSCTVYSTSSLHRVISTIAYRLQLSTMIYKIVGNCRNLLIY